MMTYTEILDTATTRKTITHNGRRMTFSEPVTIRVKQLDKDTFVIEHPLNLTTYGRSVDEVVIGFVEEMFWLYDTYCQESDENLTAGAQKLRDDLNQLIESVEETNTRFKSCA